jgi:hypothetical protein
VAAVQLGERIGIGARGGDQLSIRLHRLTLSMPLARVAFHPGFNTL